MLFISLDYDFVVRKMVGKQSRSKNGICCRAILAVTVLVLGYKLYLHFINGKLRSTEVEGLAQD